MIIENEYQTTNDIDIEISIGSPSSITDLEM